MAGWLGLMSSDNVWVRVEVNMDHTFLFQNKAGVDDRSSKQMRVFIQMSHAPFFLEMFFIPRENISDSKYFKHRPDN